MSANRKLKRQQLASPYLNNPELKDGKCLTPPDFNLTAGPAQAKMGGGGDGDKVKKGATALAMTTFGLMVWRNMSALPFWAVSMTAGMGKGWAENNNPLEGLPTQVAIGDLQSRMEGAFRQADFDGGFKTTAKAMQSNSKYMENLSLMYVNECEFDQIRSTGSVSSSLYTQRTGAGVDPNMNNYLLDFFSDQWLPGEEPLKYAVVVDAAEHGGQHLALQAFQMR